MNAIRAGDRVVVRMASSTTLPWGIRFEATMVHTPAGPGDTFVILTDDGAQVHLNGNGSEFVALWREARDED